VDIDSETNCIDPNDIEHRIGKNTKVLMLVHYGGYPCDMDRILPIAKKYNLKIIEDVSHAQGGLYKGKMLGTFGDVGAMSLMSGKSFAIGEGGMLVTNKREIWERCIAYGHYERTRATNVWDNGEPNITLPELQPFRGIPLGGYKHRMNQTCSAMGRVQLKYYPERIKEIDRAMNYFADLIEDSPGIKVRRPMKDSGSTMGGWYGAQGAYSSDELGGLSCSRFCEAVRAEGSVCTAGANKPLHTHEIFHSADIFNMGKPTMISFGQRDVRQGSGSLPNTENVPTTTFKIPWFRRYHKDIIEEHAAAYMKVAKNYNELLIFIQ